MDKGRGLAERVTESAEDLVDALQAPVGASVGEDDEVLDGGARLVGRGAEELGGVRDRLANVGAAVDPVDTVESAREAMARRPGQLGEPVGIGAVTLD